MEAGLICEYSLWTCSNDIGAEPFRNVSKLLWGPFGVVIPPIPGSSGESKLSRSVVEPNKPSSVSSMLPIVSNRSLLQDTSKIRLGDCVLRG